MSRYDKVVPKNGVYRASLAANFPPQLVEHAVAVGHDENGRLVVGAGDSGIKGVLVLTKAYPAGKRVDPMTNGEIVEFGPNDHTVSQDAGTAVAGVDLGDPGTNYYGHADGTVDDTPGTDGVYLGHTVEGQRLVVRVNAAPAGEGAGATDTQISTLTTALEDKADASALTALADRVTALENA